MATYQSIRYNVDYQGKAGSLIPLLTFTSDGSDDTADFASKIDSTYDEYLFIFNNIHPETDSVYFQFNGRDGSTAYDATKTSSVFSAFHKEGAGGTEEEMAYQTGQDVAQGTGVQYLNFRTANDNDAGLSGWLRLFNPASTTFVKHYMAVTNSHETVDVASMTFHTVGYFNVTAAIDGIQFSFSSGEIQGGTIQMFGVI